MPTLDRRLLAWSDDDSDEGDDDLQMASPSWDSYDRCATTFVDDVLVPGTKNCRAGRMPVGSLDGGGTPSFSTRKVI